MQAQDAHAWSLNALIAALLARIFGRLEQLFLLWQSGTLPVPQATVPATSPPAHRPPSRRATGNRCPPAAHAPRHPAALCAPARPIRGSIAHAHIIMRTPRLASAKRAASYRPNPARAPPRIDGPIPSETPLTGQQTRA